MGKKPGKSATVENRSIAPKISSIPNEGMTSWNKGDERKDVILALRKRRESHEEAMGKLRTWCMDGLCRRIAPRQPVMLLPAFKATGFRLIRLEILAH